MPYKGHQVISVDDHVSENPGTFIDRVPSTMRDKVPYIQDDENGESAWYIGQQKIFRAGWFKDEDELVRRKANTNRPFGLRQGDWDPVERLKDMDLDGVDGALLFCNFSRFTGNPLAVVQDTEARLASIRAYNDWLVDEFCAADPKRLIPLALTPSWDVELAIDEAVRAVKKGHKGVTFGAAMDLFGLPPTWDKYWDPLYATIQDLDVPLCFHQISGDIDRAVFKDPDIVIPEYMVTARNINHVSSLIVPTPEIIMSGMLERFPKLRVQFAESGVSWLTHTLTQLDFFWPKYSRFDGNELRMLPSDYWRRQCSAGFWVDVISPEVVKIVGEDNINWEADYLHTIATFPSSRKCMEESLTSITDENQKAKIVGGNTINFFNLET